jgi:hypothetical protein
MYAIPECATPVSCNEDMVHQTLAVMQMADAADIEFARDVDTHMLAPFGDYIDREGLPRLPPQIARKMYAHIDGLLEWVIIPAKESFRIERPFVAAERLGIPFPRPFISKSALDSSYPSGHAGGAMSAAIALAWVLAKHLTEQQTADLFDIANRIAMSRVHIGVHSLQDISEGKRLAHTFADLNPPTWIPQLA